MRTKSKSDVTQWQISEDFRDDKTLALLGDTDTHDWPEIPDVLKHPSATSSHTITPVASEEH